MKQTNLFENENLEDKLLYGWSKINKYDSFNEYYQKIEVAQYFQSLIYAQYFGLYYKIIDNVLYFAKPNFNFNVYSITIYTNPISLNKHNCLKEEFLNKGISFRGVYDESDVDKFGEEYVYDCNEFINMNGSKYIKQRNRIKNFLNNKKDYNIVYGHNDDIIKTIDNWSKLKGNNTQKKLFEYILLNKGKCTITTTYFKGVCLGFSVVENINDKNGIIIQRLINYEAKYNGEINLILHYNDCIINKGKLLNIGSSRNKQIKISKQKLNPKILLRIGRIKSKNTITRKEYLTIKN